MRSWLQEFSGAMRKICTNGSKRTSGRVGNFRSLPWGDCCHIDNKIMKKINLSALVWFFFMSAQSDVFHYVPIIYERAFAIQDTIFLFMKQASFCGNIILAYFVVRFHLRKSFEMQKIPPAVASGKVFIRPALSRMRRAVRQRANGYSLPVRHLQPSLHHSTRALTTCL